MQKDLLSKLLNNNASISTEYFTRHEVYSSKIEINKRFPEYVWKITSQNTGKTINTSLANSYSRLLTGISKLIEEINNLFTVKCKYFIENKKTFDRVRNNIRRKM